MARQSVDQVLLRVKSLERKGDLVAARELCSAMIAEYPANKRLRQALGALGQARPRPAGPQQPPADALEVLVTFFNQQQYQAVLTNGERLSRHFDQSPVLHNIIASAAARLGKSDIAIRSFRRATELDPGFVDAHNNLAGLLSVDKNWQEAAESYARSIRLRPDQPVILRRLAEVEAQLERFDDAIAHYRQALSLAPDNPEALHGLGVALTETGALEAALQAMQRASALAPKDSGMRLNLAVVYRLLRRTADAVATYEAAVDLWPDLAEAYHGLSDLHRFGLGDPLIATIETLYHAAPASHPDRWHLGYALVKVYQDLGDPKRAFDHLTEANRLRAAGMNYRFEKDVQLFDGLRRTAPTLARLALPAGLTPVETMPIFILGMPRSGTTLVEQIISAHSQVAGGGELIHLARLGLDLASGITEASSAALRSVRMDYLARIKALAGGRPWLTDKMPHNFRNVALIRAALPEARIIHVHRDPAAVCWSNYRTYFSSQTLEYSYDLADVVRYYKLYAALMDNWKAQFGAAIHTLDYDRLIVDQEAETRALIGCIGLPWEDACLAPHKNERGVRTASQLQVNKAVYSGASQEWRKFEPFLGGAFDDLPS